MSPVAQESEEPSSRLILIAKDSPHSTLSLSSTSMEEICTDDTSSRDENLSLHDVSMDSTVGLVKCLGSTSPSYQIVAQRCDKSAILRLSNELLKAKRSNWDIVDALGKAYEDIKDLRLREQRLNTIMSNCATTSLNGFIEWKPDGKIIELQLALRKEEMIKTRRNLRDLIAERDELKQELKKTQSEMRLTSFTGERLERELELYQSHMREQAANIKEKDDRISVVQDKLFFLEKEMKVKDCELFKLREEKGVLREAVIRSEEVVERLSKRLENVERFERQRVNSLSLLGSQEPCRKDYNENEEHLIAEKMELVDELEHLKAKRYEDKRIIDDLTSQVQQWESTVNTMNERVQETNERQLEARKEIAAYVEMLELQLQEFQKASHSTNKVENFKLGRHGRQYKQGNDSKNVELRGQNQSFTEPVEIKDLENVNHNDCCQWSEAAIVTSGDVRRATLSTVECYGKRATDSCKQINTDEPKQPSKSPPRKSSSGTRRKLPEVARKANAVKCQSSIDSDQVTDSALSRADDDAASITSSENQASFSRDWSSTRRVSREGPGRRLPTVPSEKDKEVKRAVSGFVNATTEPPKVNSIYHSFTMHHKRDSGLGESAGNSPVPAPTRKFSIRKSIQLKFGKQRNSLDLQEVNMNDLRETQKGLFQRRLSLLRGRKRRSSIGTISSGSDSFRTVTPLSSERGGEASGEEGSENGKGKRRHSAVKTSTPVDAKRKPSRGDTAQRPKQLNVQQRKASLLLIFRHLNPIELCSLARVSREWREMSEHPSLWKHVVLEGVPLNNIVLQAMSRRCGCMRYLKLRGLKKIRTLDSQQSIQDNSCYLERGLEYLLKAAGASLLSLHIEDCGVFVTDRCFTLASCHSRRLQEMVYISDCFPACPEALWSLWACRNIMTLRVTPMFPCDHPARFNDKSLETIASCWPNLRHLSVGGPSLSTTGLIHIAKGCLRLQELELDRTFSITEEIIHALCLCGLKGLEAISFTFTPVSAGAIKELLGACPRLESIEVHIGISDYFTDVEDDRNKKKYRRTVKKLTALKRENAEFARVLRVKADYG